MKKHLKGIFAAVMAVVAGCSSNDKYLRIYPSSLELESDAQAVLVNIESSASWMVYNYADWLVYSYDNAKTLRITISKANESLEARETTISVITGDGQEQDIYVLQKAMDAHFSVSPMQLEPFGGSGGEQTAVVSTNLAEWGVSNSESWLTVERGKDEESNRLTFSAARSWVLEERRDTLILKPSNEIFAKLADTIPLVQHGVDLIARWPDRTEGSFTIDAPVEGDQISLTIYAKYGWTVTSDDANSRLQFSITEGASDLNGITLVITVPENETTEGFDYTLTFTCNGGEYEYGLLQPAAEKPESETEPEQP